ncbi:MAG: type I secretion system permease/ATPase [Azoarcus sp.]|nr:type I secretion system permease/ATPase [Azoarcus sp.]
MSGKSLLPAPLSAFLSGRSELSRTLLSFRFEFTACMIFTAIANLLMLTPTLYMLQLFDRVLVSQSEFTLYAVTLVLLFFLGVMSFSEWVRSRLLVRLGVRMDLALNPRVFAAAFELRGRGEDSEHLFQDLSKLRQFLTGAGLFALLDAPWTPAYIAVLFLLHPALGWLSIVFCLLLVAVAYISGRAMAEPIEAAFKANRREDLRLDARMRHVATIEAMGMLGNMRSRWRRGHYRALAQSRRGQSAQTRTQSITSFVRMMQQSLSLGAGALLAIQGDISVGAMIAANVLMARATAPLDVLVRSWKEMVTAREAYTELEAALDALPVRAARAPMEATHGANVRIDGAVARAVGRPQPILKGLSLEIPSGLAVGVKGPSGSGKSTLARVLLGIWTDVQGEVRYDDVPLCDIERADLGTEIGYLPQDVELFEGSIAENVARFGEIDSGLVIEACQQAGVHDMILRFPKGYDTLIGVGGILSGGQRQRIGLARALYGNPRLVVLDEPNSSLDEAGDRALLQAVLALKERGVTVVLISHRPQIMAVMDRIVVIEDGCVLREETPVKATRSANMSVEMPPGHAGAGGTGYGSAPGAVSNPIFMPT